MDYEILQVPPISRDILLVIYAQDGRKKPAFVLKNNFRAEAFVPLPESERTSVMELTLNAWLWQSFQASCAKLEVTPEDCFNAWLYFWVAPESHEAKALFRGRKEH